MSVEPSPGGHFPVALWIVVAIAAALPAWPAAAQSPFDGTYTGTQTLSESGSITNYSKCLKGPFKRRLVVKNAIATYEYNPTYHGAVSGPVSADGDLSASDATASNGVSLSGKIEGDVFTGKVWSLICTYTLQLKRMP
jgi:hypothetical protein